MDQRDRSVGRSRALAAVGAALAALALLPAVPSASSVFSWTTDTSGTFSTLADFPTRQLSGTRGCVSDTGSSGACQDGRALGGAGGIVVSPDDRFVYVAATDSGAVAVLARDPADASLTQLPGTAGCVDDTGDEGCADVRGLAAPRWLSLSPDGASLYASGGTSIAVFQRDGTTGELTQLPGADGCVEEVAADGCADGRNLDQAASTVVSAEGAFVYAAAFSGAVSVFTRDPGTGALTQLPGTDGCVGLPTSDGCAAGEALLGARGLAISPDGAHLYVAAQWSWAVVTLSRDQVTGVLTWASCVQEAAGASCAAAAPLESVDDVEVSGDGAYVYTSAYTPSSAAGVFTRDAATGALTRLPGTDGCVSDTGTGGACADGVGMADFNEIALAPDGAVLWGVAIGSGSLLRFDRDAVSGVLTQAPAPDGCVSVSDQGGLCGTAHDMDQARSVAVSHDGGAVYVAARAPTDAVTVLLP